MNPCRDLDRLSQVDNDNINMFIVKSSFHKLGEFFRLDRTIRLDKQLEIIRLDNSADLWYTSIFVVNDEFIEII
jgi:hypothetical protein